MRHRKVLSGLLAVLVGLAVGRAEASERQPGFYLAGAEPHLTPNSVPVAQLEGFLNSFRMAGRHSVRR